MVKALIDIDDQTNHVINVVKAKYGLRDKSAAIEAMAAEYEGEVLQPALRPEFVKKVREAESEDPVKVGTAKDFRTR